jgi:hypothetical protein
LISNGYRIGGHMTAIARLAAPVAGPGAGDTGEA